MQTTTSKDGTKLAYDVHGSGPPLIYITGATCFRTFKPIVDDVKVFAREFTVYNYDRRGRGDSGNTLPYSTEREIEDVEALIDAAGGRASLYGHSSGAVLALEAALRSGDKIDRIVLYDASYVHDQAEKATYAELKVRVHQLLSAGKHKEALRAFLGGIGMPKVFLWLLPVFPGWKTMVTLAPTLAYDIALTENLPPLERASKVAVPIQVVAGEKSPKGIQEVARQLAGAIPGAELVRQAGQDHMVSASSVLPVLVRFFKA